MTITGCRICGGPLTRGADELAREMVRVRASDAADSVFTGVVFLAESPDPMCWACAFARTDALGDELREGLGQCYEEDNC